VNADQRKALGRRMLHAIEKTWEGMEEDVPYDRDKYESIIKGGIEAYITGNFHLPYDAITMGIAFFTIARQAQIEAGGVLPNNPYEQEPLS
jgi:hypothetical protein